MEKITADDTSPDNKRVMAGIFCVTDQWGFVLYLKTYDNSQIMLELGGHQVDALIKAGVECIPV